MYTDNKNQLSNHIHVAVAMVTKGDGQFGYLSRDIKISSSSHPCDSNFCACNAECRSCNVWYAFLDTLLQSFSTNLWIWEMLFSMEFSTKMQLWITITVDIIKFSKNAYHTLQLRHSGLPLPILVEIGSSQVQIFMSLGTLSSSKQKALKYEFQMSYLLPFSNKAMLKNYKAIFWTI